MDVWEEVWGKVWDNKSDDCIWSLPARCAMVWEDLLLHLLLQLLLQWLTLPSTLREEFGTLLWLN